MRRGGLLGAFVAAAVSLAAAGAAHAAAFAILENGPEQVTVLDPEGIEAVGTGPVRRAWSIGIKRALSADGPPQPGYVRVLNEYDCAASRIRWRTLKVYSRFGDQLLSQDNADEAWTAAPERGEGAVALKAVCQRSVGRAVIIADSPGQLVLTLLQAWAPAAAAPADPPKAPPRRARRHAGRR